MRNQKIYRQAKAETKPALQQMLKDLLNRKYRKGL